MINLTQPKVISFSGTRGAGKDTAADYMAQMLAEDGLKVRRFSFAAEVYNEIAQAFGVSVDFLQDRRIKEAPQAELQLSRCQNPHFLPVALEHVSKWRQAEGLSPVSEQSCLSPRKTLKCWGTQFRRDSAHGHQNYWIDRVKDLMISHPDTDVWVCSDCRLDNERDYLLSLGAGMFRVNASHLIENDEEICATGHESDTQWRKWDYDYVFMNQWGELNVIFEELRDLKSQIFPSLDCSI